ncbi:MAG: patatin-like phospholipase family protein [Desulfamplus sp.]|nr:patatin-like phospholipase family protein [Desulfamplus sp.]
MKRALILSGGGSRGSFQVGVWKYLQEKNWYPDLICGTSIGAINAVAIGSGLTVQEIANIWRTSGSNRDKIYKLKIFDFLANALFNRRLVPLMDTTPLKKMIQSAIDFNRLKQSKIEIVISAVNLNTALPEFFNQHEITVDHIMASSAMPIIFSPQKIGQVSYWDGGIMANTPILPALVYGADEIIVVLLSPVGHQTGLPEPKKLMEAAEHLMEQSLASSYQATIMAQFFKIYSCKTPKIITIAPSKMLGIPSLLNFTQKQANLLMADGYKNACKELKNRL